MGKANSLHLRGARAADLQLREEGDLMGAKELATEASVPGALANLQNVQQGTCSFTSICQALCKMSLMASTDLDAQGRKFLETQFEFSQTYEVQSCHRLCGLAGGCGI